MDPFAGNFDDPLSLHKYLYTHGDPVNGTDPSGKFLIGMLGVNPLRGLFADLGLLGEFYGSAFSNSILLTGGLGGLANFAANAARSVLSWVPIVGPLIDAFDSIEKGQYGWAAFNAGTAIVDLLTLGAGGRVLTAIRKGLTGPMRVVVYKVPQVSKPHVVWKIGDKWYDANSRLTRHFEIDEWYGNEQTLSKITNQGGRILSDIDVPWVDIARAGQQACGTSSINCVHGALKSLNNGHYGFEGFAGLSLTARAFEGLFE